MAGFRHWTPLRFDFAWQRGALEEPKIFTVFRITNSLFSPIETTNFTKIMAEM
jgi:hypothetical protein